MRTYDDKTKGISESNGRFILPVFTPCDEAIFKASYIIASNIKCNGKITALFDMTVLGNLEAAELEVKGRFICTGKCEVSGAIIVQNDIWVEDIRAKSIETHDRIIAQEIGTSTLNADGNIIVGKILAVEKLAKSAKNILCGETAYGAGEVAANVVITGEPIDLDKGLEAVIANRYLHAPTTTASASTVVPTVDIISQKTTELIKTGNWFAYLELLTKSAICEEDMLKFKRWSEILSEADNIIRNGIDRCKNVGILIWVTEIAKSNYFVDWSTTDMLFDALNIHFAKLVQSDKSNITCLIKNFREWLQALYVLNRFGKSMDTAVRDLAFELIYSNLGLKAKFVSDRLNEKRWTVHG